MRSTKEYRAIREEIYRFIGAYITKHVYAPNNKEIAEAVGISGTTVHRHLIDMIDEGILETDAEPGTQRAIRIRNTQVVKRRKRVNKVILMGRLTRDPEVRYSAGDNSTAVARYTLAVNRRFKRDNEPTADFIPCVAFGKAAEFAEKWFRQGMQVAISGRIQTGSYTNREGRKVYTTEVVLEEQEFAESKRDGNAPVPQPADAGDGFMNIPDGIEDNIPFN